MHVCIIKICKSFLMNYEESLRYLLLGYFFPSEIVVRIIEQTQY